MNRYRFLSRPQELQETDVRVAHELVKESTRSLEEMLALDPDTSDGFRKVKRFVYPLAASLPLLIFNLKEVVKVCLDNISACPLSVLDILPALAREVRQELGPFMVEILLKLVEMCEENKLLEKIFSCLSICLKYTVKSIDFEQVMTNSFPLLGHKDSGARHLASQSLAFVARKDLKVLLKVIEQLGEEAWELFKFTINQFCVVEVLQISWGCHGLARKLHLNLAYDRKFEREVYNSICSVKAWDVLRDWAVMCNGSTFPKEFLKEAISIVKEEEDGTTMSYFIKYHDECADMIQWIMGKSFRFECLKLLSGFEDQHIEESVHEFVAKHCYRNKLRRLDFTQVSELVFDICDEKLEDNAKEVFELILLLIKEHDIVVKKLKNINKIVQESCDYQEVWLGLKVIQATFDEFSGVLNVKDQYIEREASLILKQVQEIDGENLWTAAELNQIKKVDYHYLIHPSLRIPACNLMKESNSLFKLAWQIARDPASIANEKNKITDLKRIEHYLHEDPEGACYFLLGLFWERFSTLWSHIILSLSQLSQKFPAVLWPILSNLLLNPPKSPEYPDYYLEYSEIRDWSPPETFYTNLLNTLSACPNLINLHTNEIIHLFLNFFYNHYLTTCWVPLFPLTPWPSNEHIPKPVTKLINYLKVLSQCKSLKKITEEKEKLRTIFLSLLTDKNEEIRKLSVDCLIQFRDEESQCKKFLRDIAKDEGFKDALLSQIGGKAAVALCASRVFYKLQHKTGALNFILNSFEGKFILDLLPVQLTSSSITGVLAMSPNFVVGFLKTLKSVISHCFTLLPSPLDLLVALLALYNTSDSREVKGKTIDCISQALAKFEYPMETVTSMIDSVSIMQSSQFRPKVFNLVFQIISNYREANTLSILQDYLLSSLSNHKLENIFVNKILECLCVFEVPCTAQNVSALVQAFNQVSSTPSFLSVVSSLNPTAEITPLACKLLKASVKKPELRSLIKVWLPFCQPRPISELTKLAVKNEEFIPILSSALDPPDSIILLKLSATRKKGLITEKCYDSQLEALQEINSLLFSEPKTIASCLSHFVISTELGIRTAAGSAFLHFAQLPGLEDILSACIKRAKDEEQVRSVLTVWNKLEGPLTSPDPDLSQVLNFGHLQIHRRIRAFGNSSEAPVSLIKRLIIPILYFYMVKSSSKANYQQNFLHSLTTYMAEFSAKLPWHDFYKLLKRLMNELEKVDNVESLTTKTICNMLVAFVPSDTNSSTTLYTKIMPKLRMRIVDKKDKRRHIIRRFVVAGIYKIVSLQIKDLKKIETSKLLLVLSKEFKLNSDETRDSIVKAVVELIKVGCPQGLLMKEFNHGLEPELFALFLTMILKTDTVQVTQAMLPVIHQVLLEYEQYSSYYYLAKSVQPSLIPQLLASTRTLQFIVQGLSENKSITPDDYISLGLSLISHSPQTVKTSVKKTSIKDSNFSIQPGAANGSRPLPGLKEAESKAHLVFGIRLLKGGLKKCVDIDQDIAESCKAAALKGLELEVDEAVIGALDILKVLGNAKDVNAVIAVAERAGEEVTIHALKTLAALVKNIKDAEQVSDQVLSQIIFSLQTQEIQSSALKVLKIFISLKIMDEKIYDAIEELPRIIMSNPTLTAQVCGLYIQFLLTYPLSDKRKNFHLDFLVKNIGCLSQNANEVILQAIDIVLDKLPYEAMKEYYDFLLLSLITAICNEEIDEYREKYLKLSLKTTKLNQSSPVIQKIINWIGGKNKSLHTGCLRFLSQCLSSDLILSQISSSNLLERILTSEPSLLSLSFIVTWHNKYGGLSSEILDLTQKVLSKGEDLTEQVTSALDSCPDELLAIALECVQKKTFNSGIFQMISKAAGARASRKVSAVCRKMFGGGSEDDRVVMMLKALNVIISNGEFDRKALIKTLLVFSSSQKLEIKEALQEVFKELHVGKSQEEFLKEYSLVKDERTKGKEDKKAKTKLRMVSQPELAIKLKEKKKIKNKTLKKRKLHKIRN